MSRAAAICQRMAEFGGWAGLLGARERNLFVCVCVCVCARAYMRMCMKKIHLYIDIYIEREREKNMFMLLYCNSWCCCWWCCYCRRCFCSYYCSYYVLVVVALIANVCSIVAAFSSWAPGAFARAIRNISGKCSYSNSNFSSNLELLPSSLLYYYICIVYFFSLYI